MKGFAPKNIKDWQHMMLSTGHIITSSDDKKHSGPQPFRHDESKEYCEICLSCNKTNCKGTPGCVNKRRRELLKQQEKRA